MPVEGFVGYQGEGKSYAAAVRALEYVERNPEQIIAANIPFPGALAWETPDDFLQLIQWGLDEDVELLLWIEEIGVVLPASFWNKLSQDLLKALLERRHLKVDILWTTPSMQDTVTTIRRITTTVHYMKRIGGSEYSHRKGRPPIVFRDRWYRVADFDDLGKPKSKAKPHRKRLLPFSPDVAACYGSRPRNFNQAAAAALTDTAPDAHAPEPPQPLVVVQGRR